MLASLQTRPYLSVFGLIKIYDNCAIRCYLDIKYLIIAHQH